MGTTSNHHSQNQRKHECKVKLREVRMSIHEDGETYKSQLFQIKCCYVALIITALRSTLCTFSIILVSRDLSGVLNKTRLRICGSQSQLSKFSSVWGWRLVFPLILILPA